MANPQITIDDSEIAALLEELEQEQQKALVKEEVVAQPVPASIPTPPIPMPLPVEPEPEPEPEVDREPESIPVREPEPESAVAVAAEPEIPRKPEKRTKGGMDYFVDVEQFNKDTKLTEATLDQAMMEQAGLRAFYGSQAAYAEAQHMRLKARFDVLEAKLYDEHRKALAASGEKVTEKMVENAVKLDSRWLQGKNAVIEAETIASVNKSLVISLADRRDMMIQLGADRREEFKGATRILEAQSERDSLASRAKAAYRNGVQ